MVKREASAWQLCDSGILLPPYSNTVVFQSSVMRQASATSGRSFLADRAMGAGVLFQMTGGFTVFLFVKNIDLHSSVEVFCRVGSGYAPAFCFDQSGGNIEF